MKRITSFLGLFFLLTLMAPLEAGQALVKGVRLWTAPDHTRLVLDTDGPVEHQIFALDNPDRLVIDIKDARIGVKPPVPGAGARLVKKIRSSPRNGNDLRVVLDLRDSVRTKSFMLGPNQYYGHRLVVDLEDKSGRTPSPVQKTPPREKKSHRARDLVIAIDAGHGGEDPGAKGHAGVYEKDVVLAISKRLARLITKEPGMRAVMIRTGDYYLGLRKRVQKARDERADLFISIHADAFHDRRVRGSSVYTLSQRGASSEAAKWLAEKENRADLVGGIELADKNDLLASVLLDLSLSASMEASRLAADEVVKQLRLLGKTHKRHVQHAGFRVLKAPDIPSMLVETAFISNPEEEKRLKDTNHQERVAKALLTGIRSYFRKYPPPGTWMAEHTPRKHVTSRGDTLSTIAQEYQVNLHELRDANRLRGDTIRVGQVLTIP
jgi:N-acetylmuramoyl-L-alanine amidase